MVKLTDYIKQEIKDVNGPITRSTMEELYREISTYSEFSREEKRKWLQYINSIVYDHNCEYGSPAPEEFDARNKRFLDIPERLLTEHRDIIDQFVLLWRGAASVRANHSKGLSFFANKLAPKINEYFDEPSDFRFAREGGQSLCRTQFRTRKYPPLIIMDLDSSMRNRSWEEVIAFYVHEKLHVEQWGWGKNGDFFYNYAFGSGFNADERYIRSVERGNPMEICAYALANVIMEGFEFYPFSSIKEAMRFTHSLSSVKDENGNVIIPPSLSDTSKPNKNNYNFAKRAFGSTDSADEILDYLRKTYMTKIRE